MQKVILLAFTILIAACAGTIQSASISEAYKKYELEDYEQTLELITQAENIRATTPEMKAELTYLKAQVLENMGQQQIADTLYQYLAEEHQDSQYCYLARERLARRL